MNSKVLSTLHYIFPFRLLNEWTNGTFSQVLKFNLTESGLLCVLPWLTMAAFANIGGWIADTLVRKGLSITVVRKARKSQLLYLNFCHSWPTAIQMMFSMKCLISQIIAL